MKTKEDELKILAKIEELIQEAGGDESYIGMAFAGACDDARDNIKWDAAFSYMDRYECKCKEAEDMERYLNGLVDEKDAEVLKLQNELETAKRNLQKELDLAARNLEIVKNNEKALDERLQEAMEQIKEMGSNLAAAEAGEEWEKARADQAELELLKLKAKLYDKMVEEGE